jgi:glycosyltransferase involved in cell wall biosynthesis
MRSSPLHLAFIDVSYGYTADPLGGTTSAVCFLARELVKAGVACTFFNTIDRPRMAYDILSLPLKALADARSDPSISAFIFCGRWLEGLVQLVRESTKVPLIAWMHESLFDNELAPASRAFDAVAFVSEWQQRINQALVRQHWKQVVLRNAMNPQAAALFTRGESILASKTNPQILLYAGVFQRGAFHIPKLLDCLRPQQGEFSVEIYCNTNPSNDAASDTAYISWLRGLPNIHHVGMVGQSELVHRMKAASVMLAPNLWPETSCIAMIESMAAGMSVVTTNRAALPETAAGFAHLIPVTDIDHPASFDSPLPYESFANAVSKAMNTIRIHPETEAILRTQVDYFLARYQWAQRVAPWLDFIQSLSS